MIEVYCSKCGKMFIPAPQHIYKDHKGIYCSWTCFNHRNDGELIQHSRPRIYKVEQYSLDGELIAVFQSSTEAMASTMSLEAISSSEVKTCGMECLAANSSPRSRVREYTATSSKRSSSRAPAITQSVMKLVPTTPKRTFFIVVVF